MTAVIQIKRRTYSERIRVHTKREPNDRGEREKTVWLGACQRYSSEQVRHNVEDFFTLIFTLAYNSNFVNTSEHSL